MAAYDWTKSTEGGVTGKYTVYSCNLYPVVAATGVSETGHNWTPVIDFIPPGTDFTVIANTAALNTSASTGVQLFVGYDKGSLQPFKDRTLTRYRMKQTPFISDSSQLDTATKVLFRDVSTYGQFPYYWLKLPGGGGNGSALNIKIIVGGRNQVLSNQ